MAKLLIMKLKSKHSAEDLVTLREYYMGQIQEGLLLVDDNVIICEHDIPDRLIVKGLSVNEIECQVCENEIFSQCDGCMYNSENENHQCKKCSRNYNFITMFTDLFRKKGE